MTNIKEHKPTSPSKRSLISTKFKGLAKKRQGPKSLLLAKRKTNGRNNHGHITTRHRGGGHKRTYRIIDFKRDKAGIPAKVVSIEYDPNRTAHIALLAYRDGEKRYILAPNGIQEGDLVQSGKGSPFKPGNAMALCDMPIGTTVHNIEMHPGKGGQLVRSAGNSAQLVARNTPYATLKMPSGEMRLVKEACWATIGTVSNSENSLRVDGKAGRSRWRGKRPTVRGTAMNPVDHPHGGGEGRHNGYLPRTPWGKDTKGMRTRSKKKSNKLIIKDRRK